MYLILFEMETTSIYFAFQLQPLTPPPKHSGDPPCVTKTRPRLPHGPGLGSRFQLSALLWAQEATPGRDSSSEKPSLLWGSSARAQPALAGRRRGAQAVRRGAAGEQRAAEHLTWEAVGPRAVPCWLPPPSAPAGKMSRLENRGGRWAGPLGIPGRVTGVSLAHGSHLLVQLFPADEFLSWRNLMAGSRDTETRCVSCEQLRSKSSVLTDTCHFARFPRSPLPDDAGVSRADL